MVTYPKRILELDGIRGIAILLVVYWHYIAIPLQVEGSIYLYYVKYAGALTWCGVDLFFVLSGFLIGGILFDNRNNKNYFRTFYIRRFFRIFPLYFLWLLLFIVLTTFFTVDNPIVFNEPYPIWSYVLFIQNFLLDENGFGSSWLALTWSLAVEEQFYLFLPFMIYFFKPRYVAPTLIILIFLAPVARFMTEGIGSYVYTYCRTDSLMTGVLIAWLIKKDRFVDIITIHRKFLLFTISILILAVIYLTYLITQVGDVVNHFVFAVLFGLSILAVITNKNSYFANILRNKALLWLGSRSYAIYLFHPAINGLWHRSLNPNDIPTDNIGELQIVIYSMISVIFLAEISYRIFESPLIKFSHRYRYD